MIVELVGLPGTGKTTLAKALGAHGVLVGPATSRTALLSDATIFFLRRPFLAFALLSAIMFRTSHRRRYTLFMNCFLGYAAQYERARRISDAGGFAILDQGHFQTIISFGGLPSQIMRAFPHPDVLVVVEAPDDVQEERMRSRGHRPLTEQTVQDRVAWKRGAERSLEAAISVLDSEIEVIRHQDSGDVSLDAVAIEMHCRQLPVRKQRHGDRRFHSAVKTALYAVAYIARTFTLQFTRISEVVVLMYHSVDNSDWKHSIAPAIFEQQMAYLAKRGWIVPLADIVAYAKGEKQLPRHAIAITFDDGYVDVLTNALPILERYQIPATIFVPTDTTVKTDPAGRARLSWDELRELSKHPLISIGSHAVTHRKLPLLTYEEMLSEARGSADAIEHDTGKRPDFFAYPFGARGAEAEHAVQESGYDAAFGITEGLVHPGRNLFALPRVQVDATMNVPLFRMRLTRAVELNRSVVDFFRS